MGSKKLCALSYRCVTYTKMRRKKRDSVFFPPWKIISTILVSAFFRTSHGQLTFGGCLLRSCDQRVTGRNLRYARTLQIIQSEEYLNDVDLGVIRREDLDPYQHRYDSYGHVREKRGSDSCRGSDCTYTTTTTTTEASLLDVLMSPQAAQTAGAAAGTAAVAAIAVPMPPVAVPGSAPLGVPAPGTAGGGILPIGTSPAVISGLALVPAGLTAVAIFPPTAAQQVSALSVIFSEAPTVIRARFRRRRSLWSSIMRSAQRRKQEYRRPSYQQNQLFERLKGVFNKLYMRWRCVMPRLHALGKEIAKRKIFLNTKYEGNGNDYGYGNGVDYGYKHSITKRRAQMMMHDCVPGMAEPLYGFITQVMIVEDQPCQLNITCTENGDKIGSGTGQVSLTPDGSYQYYTPSRRSNQQHDNKAYQNVDRQTGEEFTSSGPPRCRARRARRARCRSLQ